MQRLVNAVASSWNFTSSLSADIFQPSTSIDVMSDFTANCCFANVELCYSSLLILSSLNYLMVECHLCRSKLALFDVAVIAILKLELDLS